MKAFSKPTMYFRHHQARDKLNMTYKHNKTPLKAQNCQAVVANFFNLSTKGAEVGISL